MHTHRYNIYLGVWEGGRTALRVFLFQKQLRLVRPTIIHRMIVRHVVMHYSNILDFFIFWWGGMGLIGRYQSTSITVRCVWMTGSKESKERGGSGSCIADLSCKRRRRRSEAGREIQRLPRSALHKRRHSAMTRHRVPGGSRGPSRHAKSGQYVGRRGASGGRLH